MTEQEEPLVQPEDQKYLSDKQYALYQPQLTEQNCYEQGFVYNLDERRFM